MNYPAPHVKDNTLSLPLKLGIAWMTFLIVSISAGYLSYRTDLPHWAIALIVFIVVGFFVCGAVTFLRPVEKAPAPTIDETKDRDGFANSTDASNCINVLTLALEEFSGDETDFQRFLSRHRSELEWAALNLQDTGKIASTDLLDMLPESWNSNTLNDAKHYVQVVLAAVINRANHDLTQVPKTTQRWQIGIVVIGLLIALGLFLLVLMKSPKITIKLVTGAVFPGQPQGNFVLPWVTDSIRGLHLMQVVVIVGLIALQWHPLQAVAAKVKGAGKIAQETFKQFRTSWLSMWGIWFLFYIWLACSAKMDSPTVRWITDIFDIVSGYAIWQNFFVLDIPSVNVDDNQQRKEPYRRAQKIAIAVALACICLAGIDRWHPFYVGITLVGLFNGLALACLTGRIGSHYIEMERWIMLLLYLYSMDQLFYSFFDFLPAWWKIPVFSLALVFKAVLAFAGMNMLKYGGLITYLNEHEKREKERENKIYVLPASA